MRPRTLMRRPTTTGSLYRLIYCSRNSMADVAPSATTSEGMAREVRGLLIAARQRNKLEGITGALLFTASGFAQVLEGPRDVVDRAFDRISLDRRHTDVTILSFTPVDRRAFPSWPLGFCAQMTRGTDDPLSSLVADASGGGSRAMTGSDVLRMIEAIVRQEDAWIAA